MFFIRIYPSKHKIKAIPQSKIDTDLNVPLAYIDIDFTKYKIEKIIDSKYSTDKKHILIPNEELKSTVFKKFGSSKTYGLVGATQDDLDFYIELRHVALPSH